MTNWIHGYKDCEHRKRFAKLEEQLVDLVLDYYKFDGVLRQQMLHDHKRCFDEWALTYQSFNKVVPDFPVQLVMSHTANLTNAHPLSKMFGKFVALPLIAEYSDLRYSHAEDTRIALVIKWPYFRGALVLHELISSPIFGPTFQFPATSDCGGLTLQPLGDFLATLGWSPEANRESECKNEHS